MISYITVLSVSSASALLVFSHTCTGKYLAKVSGGSSFRFWRLFSFCFSLSSSSQLSLPKLLTLFSSTQLILLGLYLLIFGNKDHTLQSSEAMTWLYPQGSLRAPRILCGAADGTRIDYTQGKD